MTKKTKQITCEDIKGKTHQVSSDKLTFRPAVYGVIIQDGKILLSKQWEGYDLPGGGIDLGESTVDALVREVKEETGIDVEVGKIIHCDNSFFKLPFKEKFVHSIHIFHECNVVGGELSAKFLEEQEKKYVGPPGWVDLSKVNDIKIYSSVDVKKILKNYL